MTKNEALIALSKGKTLTHSLFADGEWIKREGNSIVFEDGYSIPEEEFWKDRNRAVFNNNWEELY